MSLKLHNYTRVIMQNYAKGLNKLFKTPKSSKVQKFK